MQELKDFIRNEYQPLPVSQTVEQAMDFFDQTGFSHFPVMEGTVFLGNISLEDAETLDYEQQISNYRYVLSPFFVKENALWMEAIEILSKNESDIVPVLSKQNEYLGFYLLSDVFRFFSNTPFLKEAGTTLIVSKNQNDYSVSQIIQIVESNGGKVLGCFLSEMITEQTEITIKISSGGINDMIQTFRRYDYEIISSHKEDSYLNNLKERSEYLNKYLNM